MNLTHRLLIASALLLAGAPAYAQVADPKLDESLRETIARGCVGAQSVIITTKPGYRAGLRDSLMAHGDVVTGEFVALDAVAADIHCDDLAVLAEMSATASVSVNAVMEPHGQSSKTRSTGTTSKNSPKTPTQQEAAAKLQEPVFQTTLAWSQLRAASFLGSPYTTTDTALTATLRSLVDWGLQGTAGGVGIGVIDSGIAPGPEFENRISAFYDFTEGDIRATTPSDEYGHGSHVAGLIAGRNVGIAPGVRLIGLKVLNNSGKGSASDVLRAIEFAIANKAALNIHILNISLGHPIYESAATDPLVQAVEHAVRQGLVVVVSAGNFGINKKTGLPGYAGIASPGNAPSALTAGATRVSDTVTRVDDRVADYSSRGPSWYDGFAKPDVVAPGDNLLSVAAVGSQLRKLQETRGNTGEYMRLSGTSMAAGVTSGLVALLLEVNPGLTPNALKAVVEYSAIPVSTDAGVVADALTQGAGQINGGGAALLAWMIDADAPLGTAWLNTSIPPSTQIGDRTYAWAQAILWGNRKVYGANLMKEQRPAFALGVVWGDGLGLEDDNIVWGNLFAGDDNIVWGNNFDDGDNIVWGNNLVWGNDDNIVWGNFFDDGDNIVWGNNVVWGSGLIGMSFDDDNIVWGNQFDDDNIVWGNLADDNIVWGNLFDDNIVWGNGLSDDDDNIVWGNDAELGSTMQSSSGLVTRKADKARTRKEGVR